MFLIVFIAFIFVVFLELRAQINWIYPEQDFFAYSVNFPRVNGAWEMAEKNILMFVARDGRDKMKNWKNLLQIKGMCEDLKAL